MTKIDKLAAVILKRSIILTKEQVDSRRKKEERPAENELASIHPTRSPTSKQELE